MNLNRPQEIQHFEIGNTLASLIAQGGGMNFPNKHIYKILGILHMLISLNAYSLTNECYIPSDLDKLNSYLTEIENHHPKKAKYFFNDNSSCASSVDTSNFDSLITNADVFVKDFARPKNLIINLDCKNSSRIASALPPFTLTLGVKDFQFTDTSNITLLHEYGHLIFHNNLGKMGIRYTDISQRVFIDPYNEFFADLLAVLVLGDGEAIANKLEQERSSPRNFTSEGSVRSHHWEPGKWVDYHGYFFEVRKYIWERFTKENKSKASAQNILRKTYKTIGKILIERAAKDGKRDADPSPNQLLKIEEEFLLEIKKVL